MKKAYWLLLIASAVVYGGSFLLSEYVWWLVFIFPVPLLYSACMVNLSFIHGSLWGCLVFTLHLSGAICVFVQMVHDSWAIGIVIVMIMIAYQALMPGLIFWCAAQVNQFFLVKSLAVRLCVWSCALWLFIVWTDWYSMWIFGIKEGYPLMHPLIVLVQKPCLLYLLPIIGKQLLTGIFLLIPASIVLLIGCKSYKTVIFFCSVITPWLLCWWVGNSEVKQHSWHKIVKSLPIMICSTAKNPAVAIRVAANQLRNIIAQYPEAEIIIMPESACNVSNFADLPELVQLWSSDYVGKAVHFIFGASRWHGGKYYNSLHWVYNGVLQHCCDKRHAMLISERLSSWFDVPLMQQLYFSQSSPITISSCKRRTLVFSENFECIPYICSELFFNEWPDDEYKDVPIIVIVNDSLFLNSVYSVYIQKLLVLLARYRAIQWQRDIVYVSYAQSLFIDKHGMMQGINV